MELRLIPVMAFAAASLLAVKAVSIAQFDGRLPFQAATKAAEHPPFNETELAAIDETDPGITGSVPESKDKEKTQKGEIDDSDVIDYKVDSDQKGNLTSVTITNYREKERLNEIFNTATWVFSRMLEKGN